MKKIEQVWVWLDEPNFGPIQKVGTLSRGDKGVLRFAYEPAWLQQPHAFSLDPELQLMSGMYYPKNVNFGVFLDSCPDRWGQTLMQRREDIEAKDQARARKTLGAWDFLLGVQDVTRMGALRLTEPESSEFLANETVSIPTIASISELQSAALAITRGTTQDVEKIKEWIKILVAPGSSLGGARPKANILNSDGKMWIAKFPAYDDTVDVGLLEKLTHDMAKDCGIDVPMSEIIFAGKKHHTFLVKRFDRNNSERRSFVSAMTMLNRVDGEDASYLDLAATITEYGSSNAINKDLEQLFRRVVFNIAVGNRDDHLRNHGFMREYDGWRLAPAYDMNPSLKKDEHALAIDSTDRRPDLNTALETAPYYHVGNIWAHEIVEQVCSVVKRWEQYGKRLKLKKMDSIAVEHLFKPV